MISRSCFTFLALTVFVAFVSGQSKSCGKCEPDKCPVATDKDCVAGLTLDRCGCCQVCAQRENELCNHPDIPSTEQYESCGENLQCRIRTTPRGAAREARCQCNEQTEVCGTDGKTYRNYCHLVESSKMAKIEQKPLIKVAKRKPCDSAPEISVPPADTTNRTGSNVFLTCEVSGVPLPVVEWIFTSTSGKRIVYPTDDDRISTLVRGGPSAHVLTSWLQIQALQTNDQGTYTCIASNALGRIEKSCVVAVQNY